MKDEKITLTKEELLRELKEAYRHGYASYEPIKAGLESYDSDIYARYRIRVLMSDK